MADKPENRASLYTGQRESSFFDSIRTEYIELVVQQSIKYYAIEKKYSRVHKLYNESKADQKVFRQPVDIPCRVIEDVPEQSTGRFGIDKKQNITINFQRERVLKDLKFLPRIGDFIQYNNKFWEIYYAIDDYSLLASQPLFKFDIIVKAVLSRQSTINIAGVPLIDDINRGTATGTGIATQFVGFEGVGRVQGAYPIIAQNISGLVIISLSSSYINGSAYDYRFLSLQQKITGDVTGTLSASNVSVVNIRGIPTLTGGISTNQYLFYDGNNIVGSAGPGGVSIIGENGVTATNYSGAYHIGLSANYAARTYVFQQKSLSATWNINHNLNTKNISTTILNNNNEQLLGADTISSVDNNNTVVVLSVPLSGTALLITNIV